MFAQIIVALLLASSFMSLGKAEDPTRDPCDMDAFLYLIQLFNATYPQCASNLIALTMELVDFYRELICNTTCGPLLKSFYISMCTEYQPVFDYYESNCLFNAAGRPCYSFYDDNNLIFTNISLDHELCNSTIQEGACTEACRNSLTAIGNYYGLCINSIFNHTYLSSFNWEHLPLFTYQLWTSCSVPIPSTGDRPGPTNTATAITIIACAILFLVN